MYANSLMTTLTARRGMRAALVKTQTSFAVPLSRMIVFPSEQNPPADATTAHRSIAVDVTKKETDVGIVVGDQSTNLPGTDDLLTPENSCVTTESSVV